MTDAKPWTAAELHMMPSLGYRERTLATVEALERAEAAFDAVWGGSHDAFCAGDCGRLTANAFCRDCMVHGGVNSFKRLEKAESDLNGLLQNFAESELEVAELRARAERAEAALAAVTAERDRMREALVDMEDACAAVASWSSESIDFSDAVRVAARAALASTPAPASMPLAEVEALKMRVAEMVRIRCFSLVDYGEGGRDEVLRNIKALDLAAVVKGVK